MGYIINKKKSSAILSADSTISFVMVLSFIRCIVTDEAMIKSAIRIKIFSIKKISVELIVIQRNDIDAIFTFSGTA
jgi:hypothetical protein